MAGTVAITGAASGIGQTACHRLLDAGWIVFGLDNARDRLDQVAARYAPFQDRFKPILCDVSDAGRVAAAFREIGSVSPTLNALITCAGALLDFAHGRHADRGFRSRPQRQREGHLPLRAKALPLLRAAATPDYPSRVVLLSSVAALRPKIVSGTSLCRVESRGQPVVPGHGRRVGAVRRVGQRSGAWHRRHARWSRPSPIWPRRRVTGRRACRRWAGSRGRMTSST